MEMKEMKNSGSISYSRECSLCLVSPRCRVVFTLCGHFFCVGCAMKMDADARFGPGIPQSEIACPTCRKVSRFTGLTEELEEEPETKGEKCADDVLTANKNSDRYRRLVREVAKEMSASERLGRVAFHTCISRPGYKNIVRRVVAAAAAANNTVAATAAKLEIRRLNSAVFEAVLAIEALEGTMDTAPAHAHNALTHAVCAHRDARNVERQRKLKAAAVYKEAFSKMPTCAEIHKAMELLVSYVRLENMKCESLGLLFSRLCRACNINSPRRRSFFINCGHAVCRECAEKSAAASVDAQSVDERMCEMKRQMSVYSEESAVTVKRE